jgi:glycosyltransferase involved in cell wall biosynthesis
MSSLSTLNTATTGLALPDVARGVHQAPTTPAVTVSVIVPVRDGADVLPKCLEAVCASDYPHFECIVVDDGSTDASAEIARRYLARVISLGQGPFGPACARNRGAEAAQGDVLFFVDADVVIHPDSLRKVAETMAQRPDVDAVFGSYDEAPGDGDFVSQYKNLFHHFVHQKGQEEGFTFWSGCGAVRREAFLAVGGFDARRYPRPSIEDIDLGCRLRAAGHRILLNKAILAKHLKRWTLKGMTFSDVFDRAIPWTLLILRERSLPNDLNLRFSQRLSAMLLYAILLGLSVSAVFHNAAVLLLLLGGLSLLVIGSWRWQVALPPAMGWRAELVTIGLVAAIVGVALSTGASGVLPFLAPAVLGVLAVHGAAPVRLVQTRGFFAVVLLGLAAAIGVVLLAVPAWIGAPFVLALGLIVVLNYELYLFFARKRGLIFAVAVVPFQLLYYFYSVLAFAAATGLHLLKVDFQRSA